MHAAIRERFRPHLIALASWMILIAPATLEAQGVFNGATIEEVKDLPLTPEERQLFIGRYSIPAPDSTQDPITIRVYEVDDALFGQGGGDPTRMLYQGDNTFRPAAETVAVITFVVEDGRAARFSMVYPDTVIQGVRVSDQAPP